MYAGRVIEGLLGSLGLLIFLGGPVLGVWLAVRLYKRRKGYSRAVLVAGSLTAFAAASGAVGTVFGLVMAFGAVGGESIDPSQKARVLAEGISVAMNSTALGVMLLVPSSLVLWALLRKDKKNKERGAGES